MLCPICKTTLVPGSQKKYETLADHVCNPNGSPSLRDTFNCPNESCEACKDGIFWADDGEGCYGDLRKKYPWIDNNDQPFDSPHRAIHFQYSYHDEDRSFIVHRKVNYESNDHGDKVGKKVRYTLSIRKDGGYVHYISGIHMFLYGMRCFYHNRKTHLEGKPWKSVDGQSYWSQQILDQIKRADWPRAEWWRKLETWWIMTFHRKFVDEIKRG